MRLSVALVLASLLFCPRVDAAGKYARVDYPPSQQAGELTFGVTYTVWIPEGVSKLRGVIVHQHGCGSGACQGGETAAFDLHWQALAQKWDCALLGPSYHQEDGQNCRLWCDPRNGSAQTYLRCLRELGNETQHSELATVPWCLWGHSGGGFWASLMQTMYPERIVALWCRSGTAYSAWKAGEVPAPEIPAAAYQIPLMLNPGAKENNDLRFQKAWTGSLEMFQAYRAQGALVGFAPDPRTAHECGDSRYLAIPFFDACLAQRLPAKGAAEQTLRPMDPQAAWLAEPLSDEPLPAAQFAGAATSAAWLPNGEFARAWSEYVQTGAVSDATPPPAPQHVSLTVHPDRTAELRWDASADFESGVREFVIQRDGQDIARVPETPVGRFGRPLFQRMSYHDTPEKPLPAMRFLERLPESGPTPEYRVVAVNSVDARSAPSAVATSAPSQDNTLSDAERAAGWKLLFDGRTLNGWTLNTQQPSQRPVESGALNPHKSGGYMLIHEQVWDNFQLALDFKISPGCNSGIFVRTFPLTPRPGKDVGFNGIEIAVDDTQTAGFHDTGAIYDLVKPTKNAMQPAGEWNHIVITCQRNIIAVELNGVQVSRMDLDQWTEPNKRPDGSAHKFDVAYKDHPRRGYIGLQDHGRDCWYKNIKLLPLR